METYPVEVTFDFNKGDPQWTFVPPSVHVENGTEATIIWTLTKQSTPGATFTPEGAIAFKPTAPGYKGTPPSSRDPMTYTSTEFNDNPGPNPQVYAYVARVLFNEKPYQSPDPDVTNDPPGHMGDGDEHHHHHHHHGDDHGR
jgi:hypothetical protein